MRSPQKMGHGGSSAACPQVPRSARRQRLRRSIAALRLPEYNGVWSCWISDTPVPTVDLPTEADTLALGRALAGLARARDVITLSGALGAGKTVLARGFLQARLGTTADITSPTFTLVHVYDSTVPSLWHFDLYRLENQDEIQELGLDEALAGGISLIEWPDRAMDWLPPTRLEISLDVHDGSEVRTAALSGDEEWMARLGTLPDLRETAQ